MKKNNQNQIVYWPRDFIKSNLHEYAQFRGDLAGDDRITAGKIAAAMIGIFRDFPTKLVPEFTEDLLQVRRNINSLEEELKLATDRKSTKKVLKKYLLEYEDIHIAKQKLTPELAQECIDHCFEKFCEDVKNYKFILLSKKNFIPRIEEGERESDSEDESSSKWRDRVGGSSSTSPASSLSSLGSKGSNDLNGSGSVRK
jgi:hypothetical protein